MAADAPDRRLTVDPARIRAWAEERDAVPATIRGSADDDLTFVRRDALDATHQELSWDRFLRRFDEEGLAFVYREDDSGGGELGPYAFVDRDVVEVEVVDRTLLERDLRTVDAVDRDVVDLTFPDDEFDELEVVLEETRGETVEAVERLTVACRNVAESGADGSTGRAAGAVLDPSSAERLVLEGSLVSAIVDPAEARERGLIRTRRVDDQTVEVEFVERRTSEVESRERRRLRYGLEDEELQSSASEDRRPLSAELLDAEAAPATDEADVPDDAVGPLELTPDERGKTVVDEAGEPIGVVASVDPDAGTLFVDPDPGITDRLRARLGWGEGDLETHPIGTAQLKEVTDEDVVLRSE